MSMGVFCHRISAVMDGEVAKIEKIEFADSCILILENRYELPRTSKRRADAQRFDQPLNARLKREIRI